MTSPRPSRATRRGVPVAKRVGRRALLVAVMMTNMLAGCASRPRTPVVYLRHGDDGQTVYAGHGGDIEIVPLDDATRAAFGP